MWDYGQYNQVTHKVQEKQNSPVDQQEVQRQQQEFPVDKQEYPEVSRLLMEFEDIFHDRLDTSDRLATGELDLKLKEDAVPYMTGRVQKINYHEMPGCMEALKAHLDGGLLVEHDEAVHGPLTWLLWTICGEA